MAVACGYGHTLWMGGEGKKLFACGRGGYGQLGQGAYGHRRAVGAVVGLAEALGDARVTMVAAGGDHSAASTTEGELLTWGCDDFGQLGRGNAGGGVVLGKLGRLLFGGSAVTMVSCGGRHTIVLTEAGRIFTFGYAGHGQLGHGDRKNRTVPSEVKEFEGATSRFWPTFVAAGDSHSGAVTLEGCVFTWGSGEFGQLGHSNEEDQLLPRKLASSFNAVMLAAGGAHSVVVTTDGALWGWGWGEYGQLGLGTYADTRVPARVGGSGAFAQCKVVMAACGSCHTMAVTDDGGLWSWGYGAGGLLGHDNHRNCVVPVRVGSERFKGAIIVTAACGVDHSAAITGDGGLYTWGRGTPYPGSKEPTGLGHENLEDMLVPTLVRPHGLYGECCHPLPRPHALAFAMGTHSRLGAGGLRLGGVEGRKVQREEGVELSEEGSRCLVFSLAGEPGLVQMVVGACKGWPRDSAEGTEGLVRLVGGGRFRKRVDMKL
jgi:alpha-tubulin suppressor-like RCC1 family protein